ncbi:MAG TPA: NYN domain-containing protein [Chloroflexota bacterium]|nr:NYN domain-containing protein [Chloroflexota bacterium]
MNRTNKVALFLDMSNLFYAARALNIRWDYGRLVSTLADGRPVLRSYAYLGIDPENQEARNLLTWLDRNGFRTCAKEIHQLPDGTLKANMDVEIACDMIELAEYVDTAVLISGDGDFSYLVKKVQDHGTRVEVAALGSMCSPVLKNAADQFSDLEALVPHIRLEGRPLFTNAQPQAAIQG